MAVIRGLIALYCTAKSPVREYRDGDHDACLARRSVADCTTGHNKVQCMNINVDYDGLIPNNVGLDRDARVRNELERWHPGYIDWWRERGPEGFDHADVYLRTAVNVDQKGWATFDYVKMPDYKWGILLAPQIANRRIAFGAHKGEPVWQEVPEDYRALLRRLIVIQGDTEPATVEQQRHLGKTAPSLYDLRNLFQVNVEEARHLWAMVYLLQKYFGDEGRDDARDLLKRSAGDANNPRLLGAFNEATPDWLSFFMYTYFTDRDGKMQLEALAQSGFDPLSRTCRFMLTEEAYHMYVGEAGVARVIEKTCQVMSENGITDPADIDAVRAHGAIDLPTIQKKANLHFSLTLDLFGNEISANAAKAFNAGIKGRYREEKLQDDHQMNDGTYKVLRLVDGEIREEDVPALSALNMRLRDDYVADSQGGVQRWNKIIEKYGIAFRLTLPHVAFNRRIGEFAKVHTDREGRLLDDAAWERQRHAWLPDDADNVFIESLMQPELRPGRFASWISAPKTGIDNKPGDFEYVKIND
jgi:benzoyl-CoA 2,3-dioxygenase component B